MVNVINKESLIEKTLREGAKFNSGLYMDRPGTDNVNAQFGNAVDSKYNGVVLVQPGSSRWESSEAHAKLWGEIETKLNSLKASLDSRKINAAQFPADYYDLMNMFRLDITRRRAESGDFTSIMAQETVNPAISRTARLDEFLPFAGAFEAITGRGDNVPMMEHTSGNTDTVTQSLYALGDARTLEDFLYNDIYSTMKVMEAYARAHASKRNDLIFAPIFAGTYSGGNAVAADATGATADEKLYLTLNAAIEKLRVLNDPLTGLPIDASRMTLLTSFNDERRVNRVINGQLDNSKGKGINLRALTEVTGILPYRGDVIQVGNRKYTYAGIPANTAYLCVSGADGAPLHVLTKRGLTYEVARSADPYTLIRDGQVAYFSQAEYHKAFLGQAAGGTAGTGFVVKVALPS